MPICIECRYPVHQLYTTYSKADDRALGKGVRLTQCPRCKRFADKYVEHDYVVLFIDLVLIKPQVYRHLLFNRLGREDDKIDHSIVRLGFLILLFDVYLTWARVEKTTALANSTSISNPQSLSAISTSPLTTPVLSESQVLPNPSPENYLLTTQPLLLQYIFFLLFCTLTTTAFHLTIRLLAKFPPFPAVTTRYPYPNRISTAILVSSCTKLFPILMVIWDYDLPSAASAVSWAVIVNNAAALNILLECGFAVAVVLVGVAAVARAVVAWVILKSVGLGVGMGILDIFGLT